MPFVGEVQEVESPIVFHCMVVLVKFCAVFLDDADPSMPMAESGGPPLQQGIFVNWLYSMVRFVNEVCTLMPPAFLKFRYSMVVGEVQGLAYPFPE
jgi:hypothetical protein